MYQELHCCQHLPPPSTFAALSNLLLSKEKWVCSDCPTIGPQLWICLFPNCNYIGCSEKKNDHSTKHNEEKRSHCVHMNLGTKRCWCYACKCEVFLEAAAVSQLENGFADADSTSAGSGRWPIPTAAPRAPSAVGEHGDYSEDGSDDMEAGGKPYGLVGLQNIGNTCYMNAALQALSNAAPLTNFFLECSTIVHLLTKGKSPALSKTYQALMRDIWLRRACGYVSPSGILYGIRSVYPMYRGYCQHDTQEFLRNFMDQLHEELKQTLTTEAALTIDTDAFALSGTDEHTLANNSYESSDDGEYETCDSGVSERSSLSDDTERVAANGLPTAATPSNKRRLNSSISPGRRIRMKFHSKSSVIDLQPLSGTSSTSASVTNVSSERDGNSTSKRQTKYRSIISDVFDGKLLSSVQCLTCDRVSSRIETFQDLSLPIPSRDHLMLLHGRNSGLPGATCTNAVLANTDGWVWWIIAWIKSWFYGPTVTLHDCLSAFFSTDELKGDNMYSCEKCNKLRNGIKFSKVLQLPEVLCIHLKRFRHELMFSSKISSFVSFPLKGLDMQLYLHSDCVSKVSTYELFSVICHYGTGGGGHYISYALNGDSWYEFDDQYVTRVTADKVQSSEAYVLFYRKVADGADAIRDKAAALAATIDGAAAESAATGGAGGVLISKQWISRFQTCSEPGPIDNSDFLCQHGSVNPDREPLLRDLAILLPPAIYDYLHRQFGGYRPLSSTQQCTICQAFNNRRFYELTALYKLDVDVVHPKTHLIDTAWYDHWHQFLLKRTGEQPPTIDNTRINTADINDTVSITEDLWKYLHSVYGGGPEIRVESQVVDSVQQSPTTTIPDNTGVDDDDDDVDKSATVEFVTPVLKRKPDETVGLINAKLYESSTIASDEQPVVDASEPVESKADNGESPVDDSNKSDDSTEQANDSAEPTGTTVDMTRRRRITPVPNSA